MGRVNLWRAIKWASTCGEQKASVSRINVQINPSAPALSLPAWHCSCVPASTHLAAAAAPTFPTGPGPLWTESCISHHPSSISLLGSCSPELPVTPLSPAAHILFLLQTAFPSVSGPFHLVSQDLFLLQHQASAFPGNWFLSFSFLWPLSNLHFNTKPRTPMKDKSALAGCPGGCESCWGDSVLSVTGAVWARSERSKFLETVLWE